jgi:hypothetical protein
MIVRIMKGIVRSSLSRTRHQDVLSCVRVRSTRNVISVHLAAGEE